MAESSIAVAVRIRPFNAKEAAQLAPQDTYQPFLGDGGLSGGSVVGVSSSSSNAPLLRTKFLRPIITPVDDKVLIFDPPDNSALSTLYSTPTQNTFAFGKKKAKDVRYAFDRVFDEKCGQRDIFENTTKPLLDGILNGYNASVFAYGATGCGKTHTISGTPEDPGVIFLTMKELYERIEMSREDSEVQVRLSYLEIYNESIRDLLSPTPTPPGQGLMLREDAARKISVVGITEHVPESPERVLEMIQEGNLRRTMSPTEANAVSSRSHAVLQINVTQRPRTASTITETTSASLNIIDLAGSERASATRNNGIRMKEGANINKSLLALGNCINALCQSDGQRLKHVPYRNSKLTRLLKFSLGGNCKTVMIVCVSPSSAHYDETHNTLKYANQAKNIRTKVSRNMLNVDRHVAQYVQAIHELRQEVSELKSKLAEKAGTETASVKKSKAEVLKEVHDTKERMKSSTESVINFIRSHAGVESQMENAASRLTSHQQNLNSIESRLTCSSSEEREHLKAIRDFYFRLEAKEDAILQDGNHLSAFRSISNSIDLHRSSILAASRNTQFDEEAVETIRLYGDCMIAEMNKVRNEVNYESSKAILETQGVELDQLLEASVKSSNTLRNLAAQIDTVVDENTENGKEVLAISQKMAEIQVEIVGLISVLSSAPEKEVKRPLKRCVNVVPLHHMKEVRQPMPLFARTSVAGTSNKALLPTTSPRKIKLRRSSVGPRKRAVQLTRSTASSTRSASSSARPSAPKKAFRWADEAGEGNLDDLNRSITITSPPSNTALSTSAADESDLIDLDTFATHTIDKESVTLSREDEEEKRTKVEVAMARPGKREGGGIFERNYLSKKEAKMENGTLQDGVKAGRNPFTELNSEVGDASVGSSDDSSMQVMHDLNTAPVRNSPYQRRISQLGQVRKKARSSLSEVGGPIRRINSGTTHRVAVGPPSFTASRSGRASVNISHQSKFTTVTAQSSPAPASHHATFHRNSNIGNSSGTAWR